MIAPALRKISTMLLITLPVALIPEAALAEAPTRVPETLLISSLSKNQVASSALPSREGFLTSVTLKDFSSAAEKNSEAEQIEELLELTDAAEFGIQAMNMTIEDFRISMPQIPDEWWDKFRGKVDREDLVNLIVPIYERNFTSAEINAMIEFYRTPEGQSVIAKMQTVFQESMMAGQIWGESIAQELIRELEADGYSL
jgi:uncharacterized protein